jgi:RNA recognition motif-containing protein
MASKSLYVGNLPYGTTEQELREMFAQWEPTEIRLIRDKGFGFVDVPEGSAQEAISAMNGKDVSGRPLTVNEARPRGERSGGGGGGGDRREGFRGGGGGRGRRRW